MDTSVLRSFASWAVAGFLLAGSLISIASVGLYALPVALVVLVIVARAFRLGVGSFGFFAGGGFALLVVAVITALEPGGHCSGPITIAPGQQQTSVTCGGTSATPWIVAGAIAVAIGLVGVLVAQRR